MTSRRASTLTSRSRLRLKLTESAAFFSTHRRRDLPPLLTSNSPPVAWARREALPDAKAPLPLPAALAFLELAVAPTRPAAPVSSDGPPSPRVAAILTSEVALRRYCPARAVLLPLESDLSSLSRLIGFRTFAARSRSHTARIAERLPLHAVLCA